MKGSQIQWRSSPNNTLTRYRKPVTEGRLSLMGYFLKMTGLPDALQFIQKSWCVIIQRFQIECHVGAAFVTYGAWPPWPTGFQTAGRRKSVRSAAVGHTWTFLCFYRSFLKNLWFYCPSSATPSAAEVASLCWRTHQKLSIYRPIGPI